MEIDQLEADLRTLADLAYKRANAQTEDPDAAVLAETMQNIAVRLSSAIRLLQQEVAAMRPRTSPGDVP